jgi:aspartyl-tRNA(Asn)/glutamyl-tRNA(Gln) amidotransferase subunit A
MVGTRAVRHYDAYYLKAQKIRRLIKNDFVAASARSTSSGPTTPQLT